MNSVRHGTMRKSYGNFKRWGQGLRAVETKSNLLQYDSMNSSPF